MCATKKLGRWTAVTNGKYSRDLEMHIPTRYAGLCVTLPTRNAGLPT